ncbi:meteorin-like protein isoform X2 [Pipra filicauda]|uniref:Meteorin-like protein isoform X2 n=2 Tax=Pipra filicauda TaxID=649802 RepID=A0A7R5KZ01_9PASS|nr:meteorin-like protein isoform X2 [Pipra filicauda]
MKADGGVSPACAGGFSPSWRGGGKGVGDGLGRHPQPTPFPPAALIARPAPGRCRQPMATVRGSPGLPALLRLLLLLGAGGSRPGTADRCSWRGSGLSREPRSRAVEQVHLRCTEGSLEWMYPTRALRVVLEPNLSSAQHTTVCIKPASDFQGANIYVERAGQLHLVLSEAEGARPHHVSCFSAHRPQRVALFLQASPQRDISRRTASFQYELLSNQSTAGPDFKKMALVEAMCRPCDNVELLMAICSSDFVVKGSIRNVSHDSENHMSRVDVSVQRVYRQKNRIFQQDEGSGEWRGPIRTLLQCKVKKGGGDFLFTGNEHFGEAWLGCAPRFKDFMFVYRAARERGANPCEFELN